VIQLDDLDQVVSDLRSNGIYACREFVYSAHGCVEGLEIDGEFFPLWELKLAENTEAFSRMEFAAIKSNRRHDWSVEPPRPAVRVDR